MDYDFTKKSISIFVIVTIITYTLLDFLGNNLIVQQWQIYLLEFIGGAFVLIAFDNLFRREQKEHTLYKPSFLFLGFLPIALFGVLPAYLQIESFFIGMGVVLIGILMTIGFFQLVRVFTR